MIRWDLTLDEHQQLRSILTLERQRLESKNGDHSERILLLKRLIKSMEHAADYTGNSDLICYCDTNYDFHRRQLQVIYRIGDDPRKCLTFENMEPPPDEYLGIIEVLKQLHERAITGKVLIITDASRCALALQMRLRKNVPNHSENQAPRNEDFGLTHDKAARRTLELEAAGCLCEFRYRNRGFINDALGIK